MTKIKMLNDRIIFDGHADTQQECETITLMCDNLAKSKDFKTVRYENGYAEFEKVGKTNELKFIPGDEYVTINFDEHITKVVGVFLDETYEWTTSGQRIKMGNNIAGSLDCTVYFEGSYKIGTIEHNYSETITPTSDNTVSLYVGEGGSDRIYTITSEPIATKQTIDVSELSGWANLSTGNHQITIKTKASGYADSAASNAVTVAKAASGYSVSVATYENDGTQSYEYSTDNGVTWNAFTGEGQIVASATQIKFRVTGATKVTEASIHSILLNMDIQFSAPGDTVGTWHYSENYTLTQNIDDIICRASL